MCAKIRTLPVTFHFIADFFCFCPHLWLKIVDKPFTFAIHPCQQFVGISPEGQSNRRPLRGAPVELRTIK